MPVGIPDELTIIDVEESALDAASTLADADGALHVTPTVSLGHRMLRSCLRAGADDLVESAIGEVVSSALGAAEQPLYSHPSTELTHRRVVLQTCELLQVAPATMSLVLERISAGDDDLRRSPPPRASPTTAT